MPLTADQLQRTWVQFKVYKDPDSRVGLIDHYSYLVKITAGRLVTSFPGGIDRDDLVSAGVIGLIKSVDQYDPTREVKFETYAIAVLVTESVFVYGKSEPEACSIVLYMKHW